MEQVRKPVLSVRKIAVAGILSALAAVFALTPSIGYIPIPPLTITIMHIPVIIAAVLEGPVVGGFVGLIFGLSSMYAAATVFAAWPAAFIFLNPLVAVLPRILIGVAAYYVFVLFKKLFKNQTLSAAMAAVIGTLTNTIGVLIMAYLFYFKSTVEVPGATSTIVQNVIPYAFAGVLLNMIAELAAAIVVCVPAILAVQRMKKRV